MRVYEISTEEKQVYVGSLRQVYNESFSAVKVSEVILTIEENYKKNTKNLQELFLNIKNTRPNDFRTFSVEEIEETISWYKRKEKEDLERSIRNQFIKISEGEFLLLQKKLKEIYGEDLKMCKGGGIMWTFGINKEPYAFINIENNTIEVKSVLIGD